MDDMEQLNQIASSGTGCPPRNDIKIIVISILKQARQIDCHLVPEAVSQQ